MNVIRFQQSDKFDLFIRNQRNIKFLLYMLPQSLPPINKQLLASIEDPTITSTKEYIGKLIKQLKIQQDDSLPLLKQTMSSICSLLKDPNIHPKTKFQSHRIIMFLILMADLDVYDEFLESVYGILKVNCLYNKNLPLESRGQDFFKKSKYFTQPSTTAAQKNQIKKYGASFIIFCLQTVYQLAKWLPYDLEDDTKPTKFSITYNNLVKQGIQFPKQNNFQFYRNSTIDQIQRNIREMQKQYESYIASRTTNSVGQLKVISNQINNLQLQSKKLQYRNSVNTNSLNTKLIENNPVVLPININQYQIDMQSKNKIFLLQDQKNKLAEQIQMQRKFFQNQLQKQRKNHQDSIYKYEKKITNLQQQVQKMKTSMNSLQSRAAFNNSRNSQTNLHLVGASNNGMGLSTVDKNKDKMIEDLQVANKLLNQKLKNMQQTIRINQMSRNGPQNSATDGQSASVSIQVQKLKKQNRTLKTKLLTQCSQYSEFSTKKTNKTQYSQKQKSNEALKFVGYQDARSCFEPFYSNSSSQIKLRLRKAIIRQKQLLFRDKAVEVGCITKFENQNTIRLITVFTNISQKPMFNFAIDFVSREDLTIRMVQNTKNYLEISGQTKCQISVGINQIDFRCLLCSVRFNIDGQTEKIALIMPISKLKITQQLVFTPIKKQQKLKKVEKVFQYDRKMIPNIHKFKQYFEQALLQVDRTQHEMYNLKMQFMGTKFYVQCDQIENELRIAIKFYEEQQFPKAEKLLDQFVFLFSKN